MLDPAVSSQGNELASLLYSVSCLSYIYLVISFFFVTIPFLLYVLRIIAKKIKECNPNDEKDYDRAPINKLYSFYRLPVSGRWINIISIFLTVYFIEVDFNFVYLVFVNVVLITDILLFKFKALHKFSFYDGVE
jgi:hypothetical protein